MRESEYKKHPEPKLNGGMTSKEVREQTLVLRSYYDKHPFIPVIITGIAGAGHLKQAEIERRYLEEYVGIENVEMIVMDHSGHILNRLYSLGQQYPKVMDTMMNVLDQPLFYGLVDQQTKQRSNPNQLVQFLEKRQQEKLPYLFITTYVTGAVVAAQALNTKRITGGLIEYIPDPWRGIALQSMSSSEIADNHVVITHDEPTKHHYLSNPNVRIKPKVWGLGTISPYEFLLHQEEPKYSPPHILIEFSGNENIPYTNLMKRFIRSISEEVLSGNIQLSIHTMHHTKTETEIAELLTELGINNSRTVHTYHAETMFDAVKSRLDLITGKTTPHPPNIRIGKGEVPLEHFPGRIYGVFGGGHERKNALAGEKYQRGRSLIDVEPEKWWGIIQDDIQQPRGKPVLSLATLAPAYYIEQFGLA